MHLTGVAILAPFLFLLSCGPPSPGKAAGPDIRGTLASVRGTDGRGAHTDILGTLLIEGSPGAKTPYDRASVKVTVETRIFEQRDGRREPAGFDALAVGLEVEAWFAGPVMESYPVQATASEVVVVGRSENNRDAAQGGSTVQKEAPEQAAPVDFEGTVGIVEKRRPDLAPVVLGDVRAAGHPGFDRVVFEFEGSAAPGYHLEYVDRPVRQCGSGEAVAVAGDGWLRVRLTPAQAHTESGRATVESRERRPGLANLKEIESICDFEGEVAWVLGVASPNRYRVFELANPTRVVVDIKH